MSVFILMPAGVWAQTLPSFSPAEQAFLQQHDTLRLCTDPDWMPYEGLNKQGDYAGIMSEFHRQWATLINKPLTVIHSRNWQQALTFIQQKRCDILSSSAHKSASRKAYLSVTAPLIFYPYALATQPQQDVVSDLSVLDSRKRIVMVQDYAAVEDIRQHYPKLNIITVAEAANGLRMVEKGLAFGYIDTVPSINYQVLKHGISHIKINGILDDGYAMAVGIRADLPELLTIYNKLIAHTTDQDNQRILNNWVAIQSYDEPDDRGMWHILLMISLLFILLLCHYFIINRRNRHLRETNKALENMSHRDQLTGLHNRYFFHQAFMQEVERFQRHALDFSIIILDIDHFKRVNDNYGHTVGDEVIKRIGQLLLTHIRQSDVLARWGGEEFLILSPQTSLLDAQTMAEQLRQTIAVYNFALDTIDVTASFGVTAYRAGESMEECIKRADLALYKAKQGGRNKTVVF